MQYIKLTNYRRFGFTLVEIMIVAAVIALLAAICVPGFLRARKRTQATRVLEDLRLRRPGRRIEHLVGVGQSHPFATLHQFSIRRTKAAGSDCASLET